MINHTPSPVELEKLLLIATSIGGNIETIQRLARMSAEMRGGEDCEHLAHAIDSIADVVGMMSAEAEGLLRRLPGTNHSAFVSMMGPKYTELCEQEVANG